VSFAHWPVELKACRRCGQRSTRTGQSGDRPVTHVVLSLPRGFITFRNGKVVDMQHYRTKDDALPPCADGRQGNPLERDDPSTSPNGQGP